MKGGSKKPLKDKKTKDEIEKLVIKNMADHNQDKDYKALVNYAV